MPLPQRMFLIVFLVFPALAHAADRALVPIALIDPLPGAHGSLWITELVAFNTGSEPARVWNDGPLCSLLCPPEPTVPPGGSLVIRLRPNPGQGYWLRALSGSFDDLRLSLRVHDLSRASGTWGTELPLPLDSDFRPDVVHLIDLPSDDRFRTTVRVYAAGGRFNESAQIRAFDRESGEFLGEGSVTFRATTGEALTATLHDLVGAVPASRAADRLRLEIRHANPAIPIWGFASVTNNETQHVTTVTPFRRE